MSGRIVIVGAGVAGATAARTLRAEGYGGEIVLLGAEPTSPYRRPMVSKELLAGTAAEPRTLLQPQEFWAANGIELRTGVTVESIDPEPGLVWLADGSAIGYDTLLLTTGARPRLLASEGDPLPGVRTLRSRADAEALRGALAGGGPLLVVGAGLIGCEVAATARGLGVEVSVLHAGPTPMDRVAPALVGDYFRKLHADNGVAVHTEVLLTGLEADGAHTTAIAADGSTWSAAAVLIAIGSVPDTTLAERAGVLVGDGILVDEHYRTSAAGIYAAGDAAARFDSALGAHRREEHWNSAQAQGVAVAKSMLGKPAGAVDVPWGWSLQYGRNLQFAGQIHPGDDLVVRGPVGAGEGTVLALRDGLIVGAAAVGRPAEVRTARDLIARGVRPDPLACADDSRSLADAAALSGQS